ncbi:PA14 domain-containing protein, partial [Actinokineospora sp.]|uniref:PA14 domain-containing protein n=1 Tax=Actinokineospora sp. TaxID=1872133 RepID=UPI0040380330
MITADAVAAQPAARSSAIDPRDLPLLPAQPAVADPVAPIDPRVDFTPLTKLAGTTGSRFDPARSRLVSRSMFGDEYQNPDGTRTVRQSTQPLNAKDGNGVWQPVDTSLEVDPRTKRARAKRHPLNPSLGADADDPALVSVEFEGKKVSLGVENAAKGRQAKVQGTTADYTDVAPDTDLQYEVTAGSVKETIRLKKPPAPGKSSWRFTLNTTDLTPSVTRDGAVVLADAAGTAKIVMPPIETWDSSGTDTKAPAQTGGTYGLEKVKDGWILTVSVDEKWLRDPNRVYPVSIDPTFSFGVVSSEAYKSDGYWCANCGLRIGNPLEATTKYWRSALKFDYSSLWGKTIVGAKIDVANIRSAQSPDKTWPAHLYHASALHFNGIGGHMSSTLLGQVGSFTGEGITGFIRYLVANQDPYAYFMVVGDEQPNVWTYKNLTATMTVDTGTAPPVATLVGPADNAVSTTLSPTLSVNPMTDPDGDPVTYCFKVATGSDARTGVVVDSGCLSSPDWTIPAGVLQDGTAYTWQVNTYSGTTTTPSPVWHLKVDQRVGDRGPAPVDTLGPVSVNLANGNVMTSSSSPTFTTVGGTAGVTMTYNSQQQEHKGLRASYFVDLSQNGSINPAQQPVLVRTEPQVNVDWGLESPFAPALAADWFVARWEGYFQAPVAGTYQFAGMHDDGLKIWVNNNSVYDVPCCSDVNWGVAGNVTLAAGQRVPIKVELAERTGFAKLRLFVQTTNGTTVPPQIVPADWLHSSDLPALPKGWTLSADLDGSGSTYTEAKIADQTIVLTDASGAKHTWTKKSAGGYSPPDGEDGVLALDTAGRVTLAEGADVYVFRADGKLETQANALDSRRPAALQNTYDGAPSRLREIRDPVSQRAHRLHYNRTEDDCYGGASPPWGADALPPAQMLCRVVYWDGSQTRLWYYQGRLFRIEDPGSEVTDYSYASTGPLDGMRDSATADWVAVDPVNRNTSDYLTVVHYVDHTASKPMVRQILPPVPMPGKPRSKHFYRYDPASRQSFVDVDGLTPAIGFASRVTYDDADRLLSTADAT